MKYNKKEVIEHELRRADTSLKAASILAAEQLWNDVANRLYYACFYSISAYLTHLNIETTTHKGLRMMFHKNIIKEELMSLEWNDFFTEVWSKRQEGDYSTMVLFDGTDIEPLVDKTKEFIEIIKKSIYNH
ncbi:MAG: HEPN domain-containing protein [Bacteroidota bacterium]